MNPIRATALLFFFAAGLLAAACSDDPISSAPGGRSAAAIPSIESEAHWQQVLAESDGILLLAEFYADWCDPCRKLAPILASLAERYKGRVLFYRIDVDAHRQLSRTYKVRGIPYTVLIYGREVVDTLFGLQPAATYRRRIDLQLERLAG